MTQTAPERPFWTVQAVFDPDGGGKDFAYTIGLHEVGLPELHLWSRATRGEDPGHDWKLSMRDSTYLLNDFAGLLIDGSLSIGSSLTRELDQGRAVLRFQVEPPGDRDVLEAYGIAPGAQVLPIPWSLQRPAEGPLVALTPQAELTAEQTYAGILDQLGPQRQRHDGLPDTPTWDPDQRFGPLTSVVLARAEQFRRASDTALNNLLHSAVLVDQDGSLTSPIAMAVAAARPVGRRRALEQLTDTVDDLVAEVTEEQQARWHRIVDTGLGSKRDSRQLRDRVRRNARDLLREVVTSCLLTEAVADVQEPGVLLAGRGPWLRGFGPVGDLPGPEYAAHAEILAKLTDLLATLDAQQLAAVGLLHQVAVRDRVTEWQDYSDVALRLQAWAAVAAAGCPWHPTLSTMPAWEPWLRTHGFEREQVTLAPVPELQEWATCVTAALTFRARLTSDQIRVFAEPFRDQLPGLGEFLNAV